MSSNTCMSIWQVLWKKSEGQGFKEMVINIKYQSFKMKAAYSKESLEIVGQNRMKDGGRAYAVHRHAQHTQDINGFRSFGSIDGKGGRGGNYQWLSWSHHSACSGDCM